MKKVLCILLIFVLFLSSCNSKNPTNQTANIIIEHLEIVDEEDSVLYNKIKYPVVYMSSDFRNDNKKLSDSIDQFNNIQKTIADNFLIDNQTEVRELYEESKNTDYFGNYEYGCEASFGRNDDKVFAIHTNAYYFTMGAHGSTVINEYDCDKKTGKLLEILDIVNDKNKFEDAIIKYLDSINGVDDFYLFDEYKEFVHQYIFNEGSDYADYKIIFGLTNDTLNVIFNQYDIAPYAAGIITVPLKYDENKDFINGKYFE